MPSIPALAFLLAATASGASQVTITQAMMTKTDPASGTALPATSFLTTDDRAYMYLCLSGGKAGDVLSVEYYTPANVLYESASGAWEPLTSDGDFCVVDDYFKIAGDPPANTPGEWGVDVLINGTYLATLVIQIVRPGEQVPAPTGTNLIRNPGADSSSLTDDCFLGPVPGWSTLGELMLCRYGSTSYPASLPGPSDRAANFFAGGPDDGRSVAWQYIDLTAASSAIDAGGRSYTLSGWLGGWEAEDDQATLTVNFRGASGASLGGASIGPVLAAERNRVTGLLQKTRSGSVPPGTRSAEILLEMKRVTGAENDGLADSLSLVLNSDQPGCVYTLSATSVSLAAGGGSGSIGVTAATGCAWTAVSAASWITITSGASGSGSGTVRFTAAANTGTASRSGTLTVAGKTFTVTQAGAGATCTYSISPTSAAVGAAGGSGSVTVTAGAGCAWTSASNAAWMSIASGASGSGNGSVQYTVAANTGTASRSGTLTIATQTFTATQAAPSATIAPTIANGGVVNTADYTAAFAPGGMISIFGTNLARSLQVSGPPPLPTVLDGTSAEAIIGANTISLPVFFVSPGQVNAQLPFDAPLDKIQIRVRTAAGVSDTVVIAVSGSSPRLFTVPSGGTGPAALLHSNYQLVTAESPGLPGEWLVVYLTGLGEVSPAVAAGQPAGDGAAKGPFSRAKATVTVTVAGRPADVYYAGLAPDYAGLYQVNFKVPDSAWQGAGEIVVHSNGIPSQRGVTFPTSLRWSAPVTRTIGPAGGTVSDGQMTVTVPGGAFASAQNLSICQSLGGSPAGPGGVGPVFELEGLPPTSASVTVSIRTAENPPPAQGTYLVAKRSDGSEVFVKATVQGDQVTAPLPPQPATPVTPKLVSARAASAPNDDSRALILYLMTGIMETQSPKNYFKATTVNVSAGTQAKILNGLDSALEKLMAMGFENQIRPELPFSVTIAPALEDRADDPDRRFGYIYDSVEYRMIGGQISWSPVKTMRLDTTFASDEELKLLSPDDLLRVKAAHLLFHRVQQLYDSDNRRRLVNQGDTHPWDWWDEATAIVFERSEANGSVAGRYAPPGVMHALRDSNYSPDGGVFARGLDDPLTRNVFNTGRWLGYKLSPFVDFVATRRGSLGWIGQTYKQLEQSPNLLPSQVLVDEFHLAVGGYWLEFAQKLGGGTLFEGVPPNLETFDGYSRFLQQPFGATPLWVASGLATARESWDGPDFSVRFFEVALGRLSQAPWLPAGTRLKITITGGTGFVRKLVSSTAPGSGSAFNTRRQRIGDPIGVPGSTFEIAGIEQFEASDTGLLVGVANVHGNSTQPHSDDVRVEFTLLPPSGCPAATTPKMQAMNAPGTSCAVSGGLDEAAKNAWIAAQAAKGTSVTADGGTISLSINPDGTGWISPTVTYQCHAWDAKGNDLKKTLNYRLTVDSCYTSMTYCKGTYIVSGTEKWHNTPLTEIRESTSSWTVAMQSDGTYLLKIPNGHPPLWGDIPYRLK